MYKSYVEETSKKVLLKPGNLTLLQKVVLFYFLFEKILNFYAIKRIQMVRIQFCGKVMEIKVLIGIMIKLILR